MQIRVSPLAKAILLRPLYFQTAEDGTNISLKEAAFVPSYIFLPPEETCNREEFIALPVCPTTQCPPDKVALALQVSLHSLQTSNGLTGQD